MSPALSQGLALGQQQRQAQEQTLSLQARQRLALLPLPLAVLGAELRQKAEQNPFLEYAPPVRTESLEALTEGALAADDERDNLDYFNASLEGFGDQADPVAAAEAERRHEWLVLSQTEPETLYRHLERQALRQLPPGAERELVLFVCDALDGDGYLRTPARALLGDWWQACGGRPVLGSEADLARAVGTVQTFDPVGVGARSLAECLELQVRADPRPSVERGLRLRLCHRLGSVLTEPPERLARILRCTPGELAAALAYLRTLNPFPGRAFAPAPPPESPEIVAVPDEAGGWRALCDERLFPLFRVDEASVAAAKAAATTREQRAEIADLEGRARLWAEAYQGRNETLRRVAQAVFDRQGAFLASGGDPATLRPLLQREVAEAVGYDESIVSRAVKDKAVRVATSRKRLPLKAFFAHAVPTAAVGAEALSERQAKQALRALVEAEAPGAPLSDQALAAALAGQGFSLARRTVAKYREQMGIPSTRERRRRPRPETEQGPSP